MIQRIQTIFFLLASISSVVIIYYVPVLKNDINEFLLKDHFVYSRVSLFFSAILSIYSIFLYKNLKKQQLMSSFARLMVTISLFLLVFVYGQEKNIIIDTGFFLLILPFIFLFVANLYIKRDQKLIKSADRIR